jgi:hypothetical protein
VKPPDEDEQLRDEVVEILAEQYDEEIKNFYSEERAMLKKMRTNNTNSLEYTETTD